MNTNQQPESINRAEFLRGLGLSSAALMSFYCMGTLTSCGSSDPGTVTPAPTTPTTPTTPATGLTGNAESAKGAINFTLDLANANYSKLKTAGEFVNVGELVVANAKGTYVAIGRVCTHAAGDLQYQLATDDFKCATHGSLFEITGKVKANQLAKSDVKAYKTALTGNNLVVTA